MAIPHPSQRYREVQVKTAAKDDLLLLLVDGGVRFTEGALLEMDKGSAEDRAVRNDLLVRSQRIVLELMSSLSPAIGLELFDKLQGLYGFTFRRLFEGNARSNRTQIEEGLVMLKRIRDMWKEAVEKARAEQLLSPQKPAPNSTLSVQG